MSGKLQNTERLTENLTTSTGTWYVIALLLELPALPKLGHHVVKDSVEEITRSTDDRTSIE
jgi:hypothetical protein